MIDTTQKTAGIQRTINGENNYRGSVEILGSHFQAGIVVGGGTKEQAIHNMLQEVEQAKKELNSLEAVIKGL